MWSRVNVNRAKRAKQCRREGEEAIDDLIELSIKNCAFCPENIDKATPKFPPEISKEGRIRLGETTVFPNLFPFARYHGMATITESHYQDIGDFTKAQIEDTVSASMDYFRRIEALGAKYFSLSWNHLPPSGASIIHPHVQLIGDDVPTSMTDTYMNASSEYYKENGVNYWLRLVKDEETAGERFVGRTGQIAWISSFAPMGNNEVSMIFEGGSSLLDFTRVDISDMTEGIRRILKGYSSMGKTSFNFTMYSGLRDMKDFCLNAKIITRPNPQKYYTADTGFMETLHHERIVETLPESLAAELRKFF
ncbi:MAG: hypothetical protein V3R93_02790 [Candidatus Hydrothermarchaeaceae archaeon]